MMKNGATITVVIILAILFLVGGCDLTGEAGRVVTAPQSGVEEHYVYGVDLEAKYSEGELQYVHQDYLGSTRAVTDASGNKVEENTHLPYGQSLGTSSERFAFTGKESDGDLVYYGARYYDSNTGRFTQKDPISNGKNWYIYAANNPLKNVDSTGLASEPPLILRMMFFRPNNPIDESGLNENEHLVPRVIFDAMIPTADGKQTLGVYMPQDIIRGYTQEEINDVREDIGGVVSLVVLLNGMDKDYPSYILDELLAGGRIFYREDTDNTVLFHERLHYQYHEVLSKEERNTLDTAFWNLVYHNNYRDNGHVAMGNDPFTTLLLKLAFAGSDFDGETPTEFFSYTGQDYLEAARSADTNAMDKIEQMIRSSDVEGAWGVYEGMMERSLE
ncbi:MAG: RHS repeat-associated core domain-containing protein [archaeon]